MRFNSLLQMKQLSVSFDMHVDGVEILFMTDGDDFTNIGITIYTFSPSQTRLTIQIPLINDAVFELTERLSASLRFVGGVAPPRVTIDPGTAEIIILDDDGSLVVCMDLVDHNTAILLLIDN